MSDFAPGINLLRNPSNEELSGAVPAVSARWGKRVESGANSMSLLSQRFTWEDTGTGVTGGTSTVPMFAITGNGFGFDVNDTPAVLDGTTCPSGMHYYSSDTTTFSSSDDGRAQILVPGMYVIGCQMQFSINGHVTGDTMVWLALRYFWGGTHETGYSIEIPYFFGGLEEVRGTAYMFPDGLVANGLDIALQRLHPISLDDYPTYPVEIRPTYNTDASDSFFDSVGWLAVWGWRLGDPMDAYHSD